MALADNLYAFYTMAEASGNIIDQIGSNDLTNNGAAYGTAGKLGDALTFDGGTDYLVGSFSKTFGDWSISIWFRSGAGMENYGGLVSFDSTDLEFRKYPGNNNINIFFIFKLLKQQISNPNLRF